MWKYVTFPAQKRPGTKKASLLALLLLLALCFAGGLQAGEIDLDLNGKTYRVELALSSSERRLGLMFREHLAPDAGMLLVYRNSGDHRIWMKNVKIPLRVYWINSGFEVVDVQRLEPCSADPCPVFSARRESRFVLELSDDAHDLKPGDLIRGLEGL